MRQRLSDAQIDLTVAALVAQAPIGAPLPSVRDVAKALVLRYGHRGANARICAALARLKEQLPEGAGDITAHPDAANLLALAERWKTEAAESRAEAERHRQIAEEAVARAKLAEERADRQQEHLSQQIYSLRERLRGNPIRTSGEGVPHEVYIQAHRDRVAAERKAAQLRELLERAGIPIPGEEEGAFEPPLSAGTTEQ